LPNEVNYQYTGEEEIQRALENPISSQRLKEIVKEGERVVIITSDITRPMPSAIVLPYVIHELKQGGVREQDMTIVLALGSHRKHTNNEKRVLVGEAVFNSAVSVIDSDMKQCVNLGICRNGTPVDVFEPVADADRVVCIGNIEFHYFAGYSGGMKAIMPGVSSHAAIQANHSNMVKLGAFAGNIETNPVRQDIDEVLDYIKVDFILNIVLDDHKEIVKAVAGHPIDAHRSGCKFLDSLYKIPLKEKADIVVLSPGGFPKDINLYQSQKGLDNAQYALKDGGVIIWCASASEGFGEKTFEEWMLTKRPEEMIKEIREHFKLGGHKAAAIAMLLQKAKIYLVSDLSEELVKRINFVPFQTVQEALNTALAVQGPDSRVLVMPHAGSTLPYLCTS